MHIHDNEPYTGERTFSEYSFELSPFQKFALDAVDAGHNVLVCAGTGSGKTLIAEYVIQHKRRGKKVLYTAPIKALSNCLLHEFTNKYTDISFGIMTGDIKFNPDADCIIMTTEILRNLLYNKKITTSCVDLSIEIDVWNDVSAVIFDEVHYIADNSRGKVWEECLVLLPPSIQLVMLSATIERPDKFGQWIENIKQVPVTLSMTHHRVVPLNHYVYFQFSSKFLKVDKLNYHEKYHHQLSPLMNAKNEFDRAFYDTCVRIQKKWKQFMPAKSTLNEVSRLLRRDKLLPCIMFTLSRRKCEEYAQSIACSFHDHVEAQTTLKTFDSLLRQTGHFDTLKVLPEYHILRNLLQKGIAYHHSGLYHLFKEAVEMLLSHKNSEGQYQPLVKLLFATETFAVGVNMPTKCVCYTGLTKFSDGQFRLLESHEYKQMSGRAGRRGIDTEGVAILLPNLYNLPTRVDAERMMNGGNKSIVSKFTPNFQFVLKLLMIGGMDRFLEQTLLREELRTEASILTTRLESLKGAAPPTTLSEDILSTCEEYSKLQSEFVPGTNIRYTQKQKQKNGKKMVKIRKQMGASFQTLYTEYEKIHRERLKQQELEYQLESNGTYIQSKVTQVCDFLQHLKMLDLARPDQSGLSKYGVPLKGVIASQINECNEIYFTEFLVQGLFDGLSPTGIVVLASLFIESKEEVYPSDLDISASLRASINRAFQIQNSILESVDRHRVYLDYVWDLSCASAHPMIDWMQGKSLTHMYETYGYFCGNFVKDCIKINNIVQDIVKMSKALGKLDVMEQASLVESLLIRDDVNVESLYV